MNTAHLIAGGLIVLGIGGAAVALTGGDSPTGGLTQEQVADFARCLSEENATFYGAYWCPHCNRQKALFGDAMQYVDYVECSPDGKSAPRAEVCNQKGISSYPTWIIDGERYTGVQSFQDLAAATSCSLPG
ncbi:MAG: hypothetical protein SVU88_00510 [Candidatus Nanohaloarchaea archaeon]|nr:hypothetical protein [Candidatus Nanohaloarchaea archaeon]